MPKQKRKEEDKMKTQSIRTDETEVRDASRNRRRPFFLACALAFVLSCVNMRIEAATVQVPNIAALESLSTNYDGDLAFVEGYYTTGDRGGGWFKFLTNNTATPDWGIYIPRSTPGGRWLRLLNGETPNIIMWGARKNVGDSTTNIQNAVNAWGHQLDGNGSGDFSELLFPLGTFNITNTIVFNSILHLRGEGSPSSTTIILTGNTNAFETKTANDLLHGGLNNSFYGYDHGLLVEGFTVRLETNNTSGAGLVIRNPGEGNTIRNMGFAYGGYGIRCLSAGAPGLRLMNVGISEHYVAGVSIEGYLPADSANYIGSGGGQVIISGLSGDHSRADSNATASFLRIWRCYAGISFRDFKAEGQWGGGIVNYRYYGDPLVGELIIEGGTYN
ncbi:MAG: hypothetical protein EPO07_17185, partial [Verrucomicrobia bacterium]